MRRLFRITYYFGGILLFVLIALIGFTQTRSFKNHLRNTLLLQSQTVLRGELQLGSIEGNLLTGFSIRDVTISESGNDLLSAERVEVSYDPFGLFFRRVAISNAIIVNPHIQLFRSINDTWNVVRLFKPPPTDTTPSAWSIDIKRIELANAEVIVIDSLRLLQRQLGVHESPPANVVDYARIHLRGFSLIASIQIQNKRYAARIRKLQCTSQTPVFTLTQLEGDFSLSKDEVSAQNVHIETPESHLQLDVGMKGVDLIHISDITELGTKPVTLSLSANALNTKELKQFLYPWVDFLDRELILHIKVGGTFGNMNIEKLAVQTPQSIVQFQGKLLNVHRSRDLEMNLSSNNNTILPRDLLDYFPGLKLPDLTFLGSVSFSLKYEGKPLDFNTHVQGSTAAGEFDLDGKMKIEKGNITYHTVIETHSLALGTILQNKSITSDLNIKATIDGTGMDPRTMTGLARVDVDSSLINGLAVQKSVLVVDIADGELRSHLAATVGSGNYEISNQMKFFSQDSTLYSITGKIQSIDLAEILKDNQYESDLSFTLAVAGSVGASTRSDTIELHFLRSAFGTDVFETGEVMAIYNLQDSSNTMLHVTSTAADIDIHGNFTPVSFLNAWKRSVQLVGDVITYRIRSLDSLRSFSSQGNTTPGFQSSHLINVAPIDAQFRFLVKDFKSLGVFLQMPLKGKGLLEGGVVGDVTDLQLNGTLSLEHFGFRSGRDTLAISSASIQYFLGGINNQNPLNTINTSVEMDLQNFKFNTLFLNQASAQFMMESDTSDFQLSALIDSTARISIEGTSRLKTNLLELELTELRAEIGQYIAENTDTVRLALGRDGFRIQSFNMNHETEEASLVGYFNPTGISDLSVSLNRFLLTDLKQILHRTPYAKSSTQFNGIVNAATSFRGSLDHPNIVLDVQADSVRIDDMLQNKHKYFGRIESRIVYFEYVLNVLVKFLSQPDNPHAKPDLLLSGTLPFEFTLAYEKPHKLEGEVDLTLQSTGMSLEFLDPFIHDLTSLTGIVKCDMQMKGPLDAPRYEGSMSIQNANFMFNPLGMKFVVDGNLIPKGSRIQLENFTIRNIPQERQHVGTMHISGSFALLGLVLKDFDLLVNGDLKVMSEENRMLGEKLYGNLFAATGPKGLNWQGNLSSSTVHGDVLVRDAQLVLPPERESEFLRASVVDLAFIDDTSKQTSKTLVSDRRIGQDQLSQPSGEVPGSEITPGSFSEQPHNSFLDGINYDISIETQGPTKLQFVFNTQTNEELFADLQGRLYFNKTPTDSRLTGQVDVSNRSYYNFIGKKFETTGKLIFTGNVLNPELDVSATYQGTHSDTVSQTQTPGGGKEKQVLVTLQITGTRKEPKTAISIQTKNPSDKDWIKWNEGDEEANAISFIITGKYRNELTEQQRTGLITTNLGYGLASGMLTGPLSETIRRNIWGGIQSVDVLYYGGQFSSSADLRLSGQYKEIVFRTGGRILSGDIGNTNVSVELPMSFVLGVNGLRNLILTLERRVEGVENAEEQRRTNGARLFYRITF